MPELIEQLDAAVNLARTQATEFLNLAAATFDESEAARLLGRAEALRDLATEACSLTIRTPTARRRALTLLLLNTTAAAGALDESQAQERALKIAN